MAQNTAASALPWPELTDIPNAQTAIQNLALALDTKVVPKFASTAARDTAIPSPVDGMLIYRTDLRTYQMRHDGYAAWRTFRVPVPPAVKTVDTSRSNTITMTADPHLTLSLPASGEFIWHAKMMTSANSTFGLQMAMSVPSGATGSTNVMATGSGTPPVVGGANIGLTATATVGGNNAFIMVDLFGRIVTTNAGTFAVTWAQTASGGTATVLYQGSSLSATQVN